jgi:hypothetical protein
VNDGTPTGAIEPDDRVSAGLGARLYASPLVHRVIPARLAIWLAATIGPAVRQRRNPAERRAAERFMADLLLYTDRAGEAQDLAAEWRAEKARVAELFWRPWLLRRSQIHGLEHYEAVRAAGRGCLFVMGHIGATWAVTTLLRQHGMLGYVVVSPHYFDTLPPGYTGLATRYRRREYGLKMFGFSRLIASDGPPERLLEVLEEGETLAIAFDVGGSSTIPFLGRSITLSGGIGTIAAKTQTMVLPVVPERHGTRIDVRLLPPIDPADHPSAQAVRVAVARTFERIVLERPETVELAWYPSPLVTEAPPSVWQGAVSGPPMV